MAIRFLDLPLAAYCEKKMNKAERIEKKTTELKMKMSILAFFTF